MAFFFWQTCHPLIFYVLPVYYLDSPMLLVSGWQGFFFKPRGIVINCSSVLFFSFLLTLVKINENRAVWVNINRTLSCLKQKAESLWASLVVAVALAMNNISFQLRVYPDSCRWCFGVMEVVEHFQLQYTRLWTASAAPLLLIISL